MPIITANFYFGLTPPLHIRKWDDWLLRVVSVEMTRRGLNLPTEMAGVPPLLAQVRQGAWMVLCPAPGCRGAELAWEEGLFMCMSCFNNHTQHRYLATAFPDGRREIEHILEPRPLLNRNWLHGEPLLDLALENMEHGLPDLLEVR